VTTSATPTPAELVLVQSRLEELAATLQDPERDALDDLVGGYPLPATRHLSHDEVAGYAQRGWVVLPGLLDAWVGELRAAVAAMIHEPGATVTQRRWAGGAGRSMRDDRAWQGHPAVRAFLRWGPLAAVARTLLGDNGVLLLTGVVALAKEAQCVHGSPWHVDRPNPAIPYDRACHAWVALNDAGPDAGTIQVLSGSQHWGSADYAAALRAEQIAQADHGSPARSGPTSDFVSGIPGLAPTFDGKVVTFDVRRGDIVCFDSRMVHGARGNGTRTTFLALATLWWAGDARSTPAPVPVRFSPR